METKKKTWLMPSPAYLDPKHLARAVMRTFQHLVNNETSLGHKAQSDVWIWHSEQRGVLVRMVRREWCDATGLDETWWPYSDDAVIRLHLKLRKRVTDSLNDWAKELGESTRISFDEE